MSLDNFKVLKGFEILASVNSGANQVFFVDAANTTPSSGIGVDGDVVIDIYSGETWLKTAGTYVQTGISARITAAASPPRLLANVQYITSTNISALSGTGPHTLDGQSITLTLGDRVASTHASSLNIYIVAAGAWTLVSPALATNNFFFVENTLMDPVNQRKLSIWQWTGSAFTKLGDFDFEVANTISLSSGYTPPASGAVTDVAASDVLEDAIGKLDTSVDNLIAVLGVLRTATNLGTFTDFTPSNQTVKAALQSLIDRVRGEKSLSGVTTIQTLDSLAHASVKTVSWIVQAAQVSDATKWYTSRILAVTDGTAGNTKHNENDIQKSNGNISGLNFDVTISGANLILTVVSTSSVNVKSIRQTIQ